MIKTEKLHELYETQFKPTLNLLEIERKAVAKKYRNGILLILLCICIIAIQISLQYDYEIAITRILNNDIVKNVIFYSAIIIGIIGCCKISKGNKKKNVYTKKYKENVVKEIVHLINPDWAYIADGHIFLQDYMNSEIFNRLPDRYFGDDLVAGKIDKTDFHFSELQSEYVTRRVDEDGKTQETWTTIFKGIFAHADFNKEIKGSLFIEPDVAEKLLGKIGQKFQNFSSKGELIKMEDPIFEKIFAVHGSDQIEARYILTPTMMKALVNIHEKYNKDIRVSFIGSRVYVAMSFDEDLFEPHIFNSCVDFDDIERMNEQFNLIEIIINEMNLNRRIWTKK